MNPHPFALKYCNFINIETQNCKQKYASVFGQIQPCKGMFVFSTPPPVSLYFTKIRKDEQIRLMQNIKYFFERLG
jgi:hypothetical protein